MLISVQFMYRCIICHTELSSMLTATGTTPIFVVHVYVCNDYTYTVVGACWLGTAKLQPNLQTSP